MKIFVLIVVKKIKLKMNETMIFPTLEAVKEARKSIENVVNYTPLQYNARLSDKFGANIFLKREDLQPVRSYKLRVGGGR